MTQNNQDCAYNLNLKMSSSDESIQIRKDKQGYRIKACAICGREYGKQWARHWKKDHPTRAKAELKPGCAPEEPAQDLIDKRFKAGVKPGSGKSHFLAQREAVLEA